MNKISFPLFGIVWPTGKNGSFNEKIETYLHVGIKGIGIDSAASFSHWIGFLGRVRYNIYRDIIDIGFEIEEIPKI